MQTVLKWGISLAIGALFVWIAGKNWPLTDVFRGSPRLDGAVFAMVPDALAPTLPLDEAGREAVVAGGGWYLDLRFLLPFFALLCLVHVARVLRWGTLLKPIARFPFGELNAVAAVGYMAMFVFPFRLGELVRPYLLRERNRDKIRMTHGLAVIVVERVTDGLLVSLFLFFSLFAMPRTYVQSYDRVAMGAYAALLVFVGALVVLALLFALRGRLIAFAERFRLVRDTAPGQRALGILKAFLEALQVLPSVTTYLGFSAITAGYWAVVGVGYWVLAQGFGLGLPMLGAFAMMATSVVGMMIPNSPANVGSFWVFFLLPLELYIGPRAGSTQAIAYALVAWSVTLLQYLVFAGWFLVRRQVSFERTLHAHLEE